MPVVSEDVETRRAPYAHMLPPSALRYLRVRSLVELLIAAPAVALIAFWIVPEEWRLPSLCVVSFLAVVGAAVELPFIDRRIVENTSYEVADGAVRIRRGVLIRRDLVISTAQILNVSIVRGPLLRRFGLAKVSFATIAHSDGLGPVSPPEAERIRQRVLAVFAPEPEGR